MITRKSAHWPSLVTSALFLCLPSLIAQSAGPSFPSTVPANPSAKQSLYFVDATILDLALILSPPPAQDSAVTQSEIAEIRHIEQTRTPQQVAAAQIDDKEEDIFIYKGVIGDGFVADALPLTKVLSAHILNDQSVLGLPTKVRIGRPRPYVFKSDLHPVCAVPKTPSYPSGHAFSGYLFALTLIQIVPEKRAEILQRADDYAYNRMICGVHYKSDLEASRQAAYVVFGYMLANPRFAKELESARTESRTHLGLQLAAAHP